MGISPVKPTTKPNPDEIRSEPEDNNCKDKHKGDNKVNMIEKSSVKCKYDYTKVKASAIGRIVNSFYNCMFSVNKRDIKKTIKVKDSKKSKKDKKKPKNDKITKKATKDKKLKKVK